jgi:hypothetical protein
LDLRDRYEQVEPGYHMNKKHWNTVVLDGVIPDGEMRAMIDHSYELVARILSKPPKRDRPKIDRSRIIPGGVARPEHKPAAYARRGVKRR